MANKEVGVEFSFLIANRSFKKLGAQNPDGWGIGYYKNNNPEIFKESISTEESLQFNNNVKQLQSNFLISHVRKRSVGKDGLKNTHPFGYENWIFAHNGTIDIRNLI